MDNTLPVIEARNLGKTYWLYTSQRKRLFGAFISPERLKIKSHQALSGLSFDLLPGRALALIGKNGAGKSTALQILAGISQPTEGDFIVRGRVCALLELGSGFNYEFTGRENILIAGALVGLSREEIKAREEDIIAFADISHYIDQPVKFYSTGMFVRLAFAIAVAGQPDLLIVDEALAVGDVFFRQKCYARLEEMREKGMAVVLVSHSSGDVQEFCDEAILLENGVPTFKGQPKEAMLRYYLSVQGENALPSAAAAAVKSPSIKDAPGQSSHPWPHLQEHFIKVPQEAHQTSAVVGKLLSFCLADAEDQPCSHFTQGQQLRLYAHCRVWAQTQIPVSSLTIWDDKGAAICGKSTAFYATPCPSPISGPSDVFVSHEITLNLAEGEYSLSFGFGEMSEEVYKNREAASPEDWALSSSRLINVAELITFSIMLPLSRRPSRVTHFGVVDLPSAGALTIIPVAAAESDVQIGKSEHVE